MRGDFAFVCRRDGMIFRRGDLVRLNSGGPLMTITELESDHERAGSAGIKAVCYWIVASRDTDPQPHTEPHIGVGSFYVETITKQENGRAA